MLFSVPVFSFHRPMHGPFHGPMHAPHRGGFGPRRRCGAPCSPAFLGPRPGRHPLCRGNFRETPDLDGIVGLWTQLAGIKKDETKTRNRKPDWTQHIDCDGFSPDDINLTVSEGKVTVNGSFEFSDGAGGLEVREMKRTVVVPEDVDPNSITAAFDRRGTLTLSAPRKEPGPQNKAESKSVTSRVNQPAAMEREVTCADKSCDKGEDCECSNTEKTDEVNCECSEAQGCETKSADSEAKSADNETESTDNEPIEKEESVQAVIDEPQLLTNQITMEDENHRTPDGDQTEPMSTFEECSETMEEAPKETVSCDEQLLTDEITMEDENQPAPDGDQTEPMSTWEECSEIVDTKTTEAPKETEDSAEKEFKLEVDVSHLNPDSIEVKLTPDGLTVSGRRSVTDEKNGGVIASQILLRRFDVPSDVNTDLMTSTLSVQGELTIRAPYRRTEATEGTVIPIRHS